jgi:hypothetical protein
MISPTERLGQASRALELWANLYQRGAFGTSLPSGSWQAADDLVRAASAANRSARDALAKSLDISNRGFDPLADPLAIDFGAHRWLSSEREEAYSDWLGWILELVEDPVRVLKLLGVRDREILDVCASEKPLVDREVRIPDGRLDVVVQFGRHLLVVIEVKTKSFDSVAVRDQLETYSRWVPDPPNRTERTLRYFAAVEFGEFDCPAPFEPLPWRELTLRMRRQAGEWIRASKKPPSSGSDLIRAAMTLAFCGAVEQNLLGLSGKPAVFRTRPSAEYLEEWSSKT